MISERDKVYRRVVWIVAVLVVNIAVSLWLRNAAPIKMLFACVASSLILRGIFSIAFQVLNEMDMEMEDDLDSEPPQL